MYSRENLLMLTVGILLVGGGWFVQARFGGVVMLIGMAVILVANFRMIGWRRKRKG